MAVTRLLLDECCPQILATSLRDAGHDVHHVVEDLRGATDIEVAVVAEREGRLLVTYDFDFGEMAARGQLGLGGVILVACQRLRSTERHARIVKVLEADRNLTGQLTIIEPLRIRQRPIRS